MEKTNIEYFNEQMALFVKNVVEVFPETRDNLYEYYEDILGENTSNNERYVKRFMNKLGSYKEHIIRRDDIMFDNSLVILKNLDFSPIWKSAELSHTNRNTIWSYLQSLYLIGESIINDSAKTEKLIHSFQKFKNGEDVDDNDEETITMLNMFKDMVSSQQNNEVSDEVETEAEENVENEDNVENVEDMIEHGLIGGLAKELASELGDSNISMDMDNIGSMDDMLKTVMSGDNPMKFMNLLQTVGSKIQSRVDNNEINGEQLISEATSIMSGMSGMGGGLFESLLKTATGSSNENEGNTGHPHQNGSNPTRDRLRRKLEQRKQNKH
jgi:hypothetical protein